MMTELEPYLEFISNTAYRAGRITLAHFNTGVHADFKSDNTPVTVADRAAEEFIRDELAREYPDHAVVGEEYGESEKKDQQYRWIIDPIDGTKAFMRGVPLFGVLIGLEIHGVIRAGAAYFPALDEMLCAADGLGCWWNGRRAFVSKVSALDKACVCYTTWKNFNIQDRKVFSRLSNAAYMMRGWSDAYGYLLVATGRAEAMLDPVMKVWDCGPFPVLLREAGGYFGSWEGEEGHLHGEGLACNQSLKPRLIALLQGT
jgi:histidinol-phosphatase